MKIQLLTAIALTTFLAVFWLPVDSAKSGQIETAELVTPKVCGAPATADVATCKAIENNILNSTVRLFLYTTYMHDEERGWRVFSSNGHATVVAGRYLISHNHYDKTVFRLLQKGDPARELTINIFNSQGNMILKVPAQSVSVSIIGNETIMLDFGTQRGQDIFTALGLASANYLTPKAITLQPGLEVAQIDWDGMTTHVSWVTIESLTTESDTAIIKLSDCIRYGASGGGLFWRGNLIGNNWTTARDCQQDLGPGLSHYSKVAVNLPIDSMP